MSDAELSRLASALIRAGNQDGIFKEPATTATKCGELLQFAAYKMGMDYTFISDLHTYVQIEQRELPSFGINYCREGATARSETIAAVCALLALEGRMVCTS